MEKRKFNTVNNINFDTIENENFLSVWFLSYCLLVNSAEDFIIRTASKELNKIDNKNLIENLKICFFQEKQHAVTHTLFLNNYISKNYSLKIFSKVANFLNYQITEQIAPQGLKLAAASAMEQLNAEISYFGLNNGIISKDKSFQNLLDWHYVEEIEHRDYVYDLMNEVKVGFFTKLLGMTIVLNSFIFWITFGSIIISLKNRKIPSQFNLLFGKKGIIFKMIISSIRYMSKDYHPNKEEIPNSFHLKKIEIKNLVIV